ncbi:hypothetical protein Tco_0452704 [Tanacetum coccineum]
MLKRCEDTNLSLNWEKSHFMVREGIVLGHKISKSGLEVDRAKVEVIAKLPHPTSVKGVRSFLGHAGFYRRFIQDFSKLPVLCTHLLEKETPIVFVLRVIYILTTSAIKYLFAKKDAMTRLMRGSIVSKNLTLKIRDKKGAEKPRRRSSVQDLKDPHQDKLENKEINEAFPLEPWFDLLLRSKYPWFAILQLPLRGICFKGMTSPTKK